MNTEGVAYAGKAIENRGERSQQHNRQHQGGQLIDVGQQAEGDDESGGSGGGMRTIQEHHETGGKAERESGGEDELPGHAVIVNGPVHAEYAQSDEAYDTRDEMAHEGVFGRSGLGTRRKETEKRSGSERREYHRRLAQGP